MGVAERLEGRQAYLDSNVFIYAHEGIPPYAEALRELFEEIDAERVRATTSELALAEVLVRPFADGDTELQASYRDMIQPSGTFGVAPVSRAVLVEAARLRADSGSLKLPDAIHIATAKAAGCQVFVTNDRSLKDSSEIPVLLCSELSEQRSHDEDI